jgi:hypothetical protein
MLLPPMFSRTLSTYPSCLRRSAVKSAWSAIHLLELILNSFLCIHPRGAEQPDKPVASQAERFTRWVIPHWGGTIA